MLAILVLTLAAPSRFDPQVDLTKTPFPDTLVLKKATGDQLERICDSWHWIYRGLNFHELVSYGGAMDPYWRLHLEIGGAHVELMEVVEDHTPPNPPADVRFSIMGTARAPSAKAAKLWIKKHGHHQGRIEYMSKGRYVSGGCVVDLRPGITLLQIRQELSAFAKNLASAGKPPRQDETAADN